jgi:hypothetical protein
MIAEKQNSKGLLHETHERQDPSVLGFTPEERDVYSPEAKKGS